MKRLLLIALIIRCRLFAFSQAECNSAVYRQQMLMKSPRTLANAEYIESFIKDHISRQAADSGGNPGFQGSSLITIPVVVHIVYNTAQQNISDAQVNSQINVLNKDYTRQNADTNNAPEVFRKVAANCGFHFALARVDSLGYATTGIIRKHTNIEAFSISDEIKFSDQGGDDAWDPNSYLNIWVGNLMDGILGYSSVVGGPAQRDGVVVLYSAFGTTGKVIAPFNGGRTATHEIGHWLNLIHTWGDADCGDDHVADTPPQETADRGCPNGVYISCNNGPNGDMYTNYMDFTNDNCMNIFTIGQRARMQALFAPGGPRYEMLSSVALTATPKPSLNSSADLPANYEISIYPNPASNRITVAVPDLISNGSIMEIYNDLGQRILSFEMKQPQQQFDISALKRGIYYINLVGGKNKIVNKLVKL